MSLVEPQSRVSWDVADDERTQRARPFLLLVFKRLKRRAGFPGRRTGPESRCGSYTAVTSSQRCGTLAYARGLKLLNVIEQANLSYSFAAGNLGLFLCDQKAFDV